MNPLFLGIVASSKSNVVGAQVTVYTDCTEFVTTNYYVPQGFGADSIGSKIYNNEKLTSPSISQSYSMSGSRYETDGSGIISYSSASTCPPGTFRLQNDCGYTWNGAYYYSDYSFPIVINSTIYTDAALTTGVGDTTFYFGIPSDANSGGYPVTYEVTTITSVPASILRCSRQWSGYGSCNNYRDNQFLTATLQTEYNVFSIQVGVVLWQGFETYRYANQSVVIDGQIITTDANGVVTSVDPCVYSVNYGTYGCGFIDTNTLYTSTTYKTLNDFITNNVQLFSDSGLTTPLANATIYKYGETIYITTDSNGYPNGSFSCPT